MRWLISNVMGGVVRFIVGVIIAAIFLLWGFAPAEWLAAIIGAPPEWVINPWTRLLILIIGVLAVIAISLWGRWRISVTRIAESPSDTGDAQKPVKSDLPKSLLSPTKFYSRSDKEKIADALSEVYAAYAEPGRALANQAQSIAQKAGAVPWPELDVLHTQMKDVGAGLTKLNTDIESIRAKYQTCRTEFDWLLRAKPVHVVPFISIVDEFANMIDVYRHLGPVAGDHGAKLGQVLEAEKRHLSRAKHHFEQWMSESDTAINQTRFALGR